MRRPPQQLVAKILGLDTRTRLYLTEKGFWLGFRIGEKPVEARGRPFVQLVTEHKGKDANRARRLFLTTPRSNNVKPVSRNDLVGPACQSFFASNTSQALPGVLGLVELPPELLEVLLSLLNSRPHDLFYLRVVPDAPGK